LGDRSILPRLSKPLRYWRHFSVRQKLTFLQENPICVPRKSGTRELGTDQKLALPRELLPVLGFSKVWLGAMPRSPNGKKDWLAGAGKFVCR
jgi:hypothetical protein